MKTMKDYAPKPSDAIKAMIDGLENAHKWPKFAINMSTFGKTDEFTSTFCFGCAATCTVQQLSGVLFTSEVIDDVGTRASSVMVPVSDLEEFESVIDGFRRGVLFELFDYYGIDQNDIPYLPYHKSWLLCTDDWEENLPAVKVFLEKVIAAGL